MIIGSFSNGTSSFKVKTKEVSDFTLHGEDYREGFEGIDANDGKYHVFTHFWKFTPIEEGNMKFDLEKALAGEPVQLRDGSKAFVVIDVAKLGLRGTTRYPLVLAKISDDEEITTITATIDGREYHNRSAGLTGNDIVGMWVEPAPVFNHWDVVDPKWKFIAADLEDGEVYLYQKKPILNVEMEVWETRDGICRDVGDIFEFTFTDWRTSLVERPD